MLAPLFHLLNGDLCYGDKETISSSGATTIGVDRGPTRPRGMAGLCLNMQRSAANRPWMPCIGNHEAELDNGPTATTRTTPGSCSPATAPASRAASTRSRSGRCCSSASTPTTSATRAPAPTTSASSPPPTRRQPDLDRRPVTTSSTRAPSHPTPTAPSLPADDPQRPDAMAGGDACRGRGPAPRSTGSSSRCTSRACPRRPTTAATPGSARPGCRCSTSTRSTWCSTAMTTTTSAPIRSRVRPVTVRHLDLEGHREHQLAQQLHLRH